MSHMHVICTYMSILTHVSLTPQAKLESERARGNASKTENSRRIEGYVCVCVHACVSV